jgi:hypothetical protein
MVGDRQRLPDARGRLWPFRRGSFPEASVPPSPRSSESFLLSLLKFRSRQSRRCNASRMIVLGFGGGRSAPQIPGVMLPQLSSQHAHCSCRNPSLPTGHPRRNTWNPSSWPPHRFSPTSASSPFHLSHRTKPGTKIPAPVRLYLATGTDCPANVTTDHKTTDNQTMSGKDYRPPDYRTTDPRGDRRPQDYGPRTATPSWRRDAPTPRASVVDCARLTFPHRNRVYR